MGSISQVSHSTRYLSSWDAYHPTAQQIYCTLRLKFKLKKLKQKNEGGFHFSRIVLESEGFSVGKYTQIFNFTVSQRSKVFRLLKATKSS